MAGYLQAQGLHNRRIFVADSFHGLPKPSLSEDEGIDLCEEIFPELSVSRNTVEENFSVYGLLDEHIVFLQGWFKDTLASAPIDQIALLRMDGDLYESTMDTLDALYDKVPTGGIIIADDYGAIPACKLAIADFFEKRNESLPTINTIDWTGLDWTGLDWTGVWWQKTA
jgi:O-methyltransferase